MLSRYYRYFLLIYVVSSLILGACTAAYPTATATPIAQRLVATPSPLLPAPASTITPTPSPTLTPTSTPPPTWQLLTELGSFFARVAAAPTGQVWAVGGDGLFRFDGQARQTFPLPNLLAEQILTDQIGPYYVVTDLAIGPDDSVWVGTFQAGLYRFESGNWTHYTTAEGLVDNSIVGLAVDSRNNLWVGSPHTLSRFDGQTWQVVPIAGQPQISTRLTSLAVTPAGQVWVAVEQQGAYQFDGQNWTQHSKETRPEWADTVSAVNMFLVAGPDEQVWLGTDGGWLRWTGADWQGLNVTIPAPFARPLAVDSAGGAWGRATAGCYFCKLPDLNENGTVYVTPNLACRFTAADGLGGAPLNPQPPASDYDTPRPDEVWDVAVDAAGMVWFITQGKITVFRPQKSICDYAAPQAVRTPPPTPTAIPAPPPGRWQTYTTADGLVDNFVQTIAVEGNGHIWVGTLHGVSEYDSQTWRTYTTADGLADNSIISITIDEAGHKWFGTWGLNEFDGQTWTTYTTANGLADNIIHTIAIDEAGHKWFATNNGVSEFDGQTWTTYTTTDGLADNMVNALTIDPAGHIWVGTRDGVSEYDGQTWRTYTTIDGLAGHYVGAIAAEENGHIWVGTGNGVSEYDGQTWRTYTTADGLVSNFVMAVAIDKAGVKWFGTLESGVSRFDGQTWATYTPTNAGLPGERIKAIAIDGAGHKWFGTNNGLSEFDDNP